MKKSEASKLYFSCRKLNFSSQNFLLRKVVRVNKSATSTLSPGRPSSLVLPHLVSTSAPSTSKPSPVASFSGRGFDMIRTLPPQSTPRSYSGVLQSGGVPSSSGDINMNFSRSIPPPNLNVPNTPMRYNVPPPNYLQNYPPPPLVGSPQSSFLNHNFIPTAAPNSPVTPTTPRTFNFPFPLYSFFNKPVLGSPMSTSPITSGKYSYLFVFSTKTVHKTLQISELTMEM